ncbi:MAG: hypothetical protein NDP13_03045 [Crenarchaeota archaeon]|nr:hypothetical protein [Thermoproteota archaeon]MCR8455230.1 hypothetical protein [Thermoproteota archaeon]MCR8500859.1 hypothetical protein [Thermoproteota archaeon]
MRDFPSIINELLNAFRENFERSGNVWGFEVEIPYIQEQKFISNGRMLALSTNEILIRAIKEAIFEFLIHENAEYLDAKLLKSVELKRFVENNVAKNMEKYLSILRRLNHLAQAKNISFVHLAASVAPEIMHFNPSAHISVISPVLEKLSSIPCEEILVYDPIEYLILKAYEARIGKKVYHILEKLSFEKRSLSERFIIKDPCILTRKANINLRNYVNNILENLIHHPLSGSLTICCGEFMWITAPKIALNNAGEVLRALSSYSPRILTLCPSATFLFSVAKRFFTDLQNVKIVDLTEVITTGESL